MKSFRKELWFNTTKRYELINITGQVEGCLRESGITEGLVLVNAMTLQPNHQNHHAVSSSELPTG
jgi:thiamine phosphate synthase YjbQ (UPF0047 family)